LPLGPSDRYTAEQKDTFIRETKISNLSQTQALFLTHVTKPNSNLLPTLTLTLTTNVANGPYPAVWPG